ncbi:hypothetical protein XvhCFBP2543_00445 [Xanthomonas vasicola]|uniref:Secreted protein n=1 Tax=Xanthomonas vasicola TaxID=56459 RepID=A0ABD7SE59_XANVA|nr:hypothetical protein NX81_021150 [Xanthomonas vasicola]AZR28520.1 hypothetical protein NX80_020995 [Xanthomonas vasicola pv. arecae]KFA36893.1 hypothetical protein KWI_0107990 [Xanthomonas vasicola pv. vasculorum NCPPB 206]PPV04397.1 hypothetical protein XvhCFBP2543_00445 [Xanthomonas vasicola]TWQ29749.1 hypothetical protein FQJ97_21090 [Xanthomonas vasicola]
MAISKPPGFSSIVIALLYLIVAMAPSRQHCVGERAAAADARDDEDAATESVTDAGTRHQRCRKLITSMRRTQARKGRHAMRHMPMTYRRYVLRDVGNVPMSWLLTARHTE